MEELILNIQKLDKDKERGSLTDVFNDFVTLNLTKYFIECFLEPGNNNVDLEGSNVQYLNYIYKYCYHYLIQKHIKNMDYKKFLKSPLWKIVSNFKKEYLNTSCQICNSEDNLHVHHFTYCRHGDHDESGDLLFYPINDLTTVCSSCHEMIHNNKKIKGVYNGKK